MEAWAIALQTFVQADSFQVERLAPAFGGSGRRTDQSALNPEKLQQLAQQHSQLMYGQWLG